MLVAVAVADGATGVEVIDGIELKLTGIGRAGDGLRWLVASSAVGGEIFIVCWPYCSIRLTCRGDGVFRSSSTGAAGGLGKNGRGNCGAWAGFGGKMPDIPGYGRNPGGKKGLPWNMKNGLGGVAMLCGRLGTPAACC